MAEISKNELERQDNLNYVHQQQTQNQEMKYKTPNGLCKLWLHGMGCSSERSCGFSHDESKVKECEDQLYNRCYKGQNCNFRHSKQVKICTFFTKAKLYNCKNGDKCQFKHVYQACPNFDLGFCPDGLACPFEHIQRKLCMDYMYGYCKDGPNCECYHPPLINNEDMEFTVSQLKQNNPKGTKVINCHACGIYGHTKNYCSQRQIIPYEQLVLCGICNTKQKVIHECTEINSEMLGYE